MTDEQVIEKLAKRMGWSDLHFSSTFGDWYGNHPDYGERGRCSMPRWVESRDALAPVLEKLSEEEWTQLGSNLQAGYASLIDSVGEFKFLLALSPRDLAHAIAEAML